MAASSFCSRLLISLSSLKSAARPMNHSSLLNSSSATVSHRRFPSFMRTRVYQLGSVQSLLPLHNAVATARMVSSLSSDSRSCQALSQGILCCNYAGP
ncbi:protein NONRESPONDING TO OXYLIPINS 2, mitochondrial-like isoform X2 [Gastrolobium bilobum]|uniref:protein NONRESPONDING TO OXYLIPINS 2, mitochondrial-like isoform X2 n=1 Tax=Gastrolobium bilobum TaxID=150636 RepID=UPI002AB0A074|nr:protein NONRESPONDING TO OXYLIPINS 2, mitochondrial-like isoform X2 [Gastrolobium bilobum]